VRCSRTEPLCFEAARNRRFLSVNHLKGFKRLYHGDRSEIIWLPFPALMNRWTFISMISEGLR
jgi:hypothetical protein